MYLRTRNIVALLCVCLLLGSVAAGAATVKNFRVERDKYDIDSAHSSIQFSIGFMGLSDVQGAFGNYFGTVLYDEEDVARSSISVVIRTESISTQSAFRDRHLKSADFFDAEKNPLITFNSERIEKQGDGFVVYGPLTMHGVTKPVAISFQRLHGRTTDMWENQRIGFLGKVKLDRREFGIVGPQQWESVLDAGRLTIGNEVTIRLEISARISNFGRINVPPNSPASGIWKAVQEQGVEAGVKLFEDLMAGGEQKPQEGALNTMGYKLMGEGKLAEATRVFEANAKAFPSSANVFDSLAEAYLRAGKREQAIEMYKKSLGLNPMNVSAREMLKQLDGN